MFESGGMHAPVRGTATPAPTTSPRFDVFATAVIVLPTALVVPLAGIDLVVHTSLKLVALAAATALLARHARAIIATSWLEGALAAFAVLAGASTIAAGAELSAAVPVLIPLALLALLAWCSRRALADRWEAIETAVMVAAAIVGGCALLELLGVELPWTAIRRPESTLGNRNHVAHYLALALPIAMTAALRGRRSALTVITLGATVVIATRCRGAYLALFAALVVFLFSCTRLRSRARPRARVAVGFALALGFAGGIAPWPGVTFANSVANAGARVFAYRTGSGLVRMYQHRTGVAALVATPARIPTGFGAGTWEHVASAHAHAGGTHTPRFTRAAVPNSELLRILVEQGALGFVTLAFSFALAVRQALARGAASAAHRRAGGLATLTAAAVCAVFDPVIVRAECVALLGVVLGVTGAPPGAGSAATNAGSRVWGARVAARIAIVLASMLALASALRGASYMFASTRSLDAPLSIGSANDTQLVPFPMDPRIHEYRAIGLAARRRCSEAERELDAFVAARPYHWGAWIDVARCYAETGNHEAARRMRARALAFEPHVDALEHSVTPSR